MKSFLNYRSPIKTNDEVVTAGIKTALLSAGVKGIVIMDKTLKSDHMILVDSGIHNCCDALLLMKIDKIIKNERNLQKDDAVRFVDYCVLETPDEKFRAVINPDVYANIFVAG